MKNFEDNASVLKSLLIEEAPFLTVNKIESVAKECGTKYSEIISILNNCRSRQFEIKACLLALAKKYRPDVVAELDDVLAAEKL